jgi:hypothetical protein
MNDILERSDRHDVTEVLSWNLPGETKESHEQPVRITGVSVER